MGLGSERHEAGIRMCPLAVEARGDLIVREAPLRRPIDSDTTILLSSPTLTEPSSSWASRSGA